MVAAADIEHLAQLARLSFSDPERIQIQTDILQVLNYVEQLNTLDLNGVEPTSHVMSLHSVLREDQVQSTLSKEKVFLNALEQEANCFKVPQMMTGD